MTAEVSKNYYDGNGGRSGGGEIRLESVVVDVRTLYSQPTGVLS